MFTKRMLLSSVAAFGMLSSIAVQADDGLSADIDIQAQAEQLLKSSFSNFQFYSVKPSAVKGLYEIDTGSNIVYYSADANVLIFGEMYNDRGENLSEASIALAAAERLKDLDLSVALEFGPADAPVITEYSNPLCGWCQRLHGWFDGEGRDLNVRRQIIFAVGHSSKSQELAEHILCSDDPEQAFADVYSRRTPRRLLRCDEGRDLVQQHIQITQAAGVSSTPTLFADGERIRGFDAVKIRDYLVAANIQEIPQGEDE
jgi:thiol:disulfide interchange protein DsbC